MKNILKLLLPGLLTWLIPFLVSFLFFDKSAGLTINIFLFKTIMIIVGGLTGAFVIVFYFSKLKSAFLKHGFLTGIVWFIINIILDLAILLPMSKMSYSDYFMQIGLRYLMIPIMCILVGYLIEIKTLKSQIQQ